MKTSAWIVGPAVAIHLIAGPVFAQNAPKAGAPDAPAARGAGAEEELKPRGGQMKAAPNPAPAGAPAEAPARQAEPMKPMKGQAEPMKGQAEPMKGQAEPMKGQPKPDGAAGAAPKPGEPPKPGEAKPAPGTKAPAAEQKAGEQKPAAPRPAAAARPAPKITTVQQTRVREVFRTIDVRPVHVDFAVNIGVAVPRTVVINPVPREIISVVPEYEGFDYFIIPGQIVFVDPETLDIVAILPL